MKWRNRGHEFDSYWNEVRNIESVYLLGAGDYGELAYNYLKERINVIGFIDNDDSKNEYMGLKVFRPSDIELDKSIAIVASVSRTTFYNESFKQMCNDLFEKVYDMHTFISILGLYRFNEVVFGEIGFLPTPVCNLKCKHCLNFSPYLKKSEHRNIDLLKQDLDLYFRNIDYTLLFHLTGGEPFLYPNLFDLIDYIGKVHRQKIGRIMITTNSTIVPHILKESLFFY